jgi:hypothetical protein
MRKLRRERTKPKFCSQESLRNLAFEGPPNRVPPALKNTQKALFIQGFSKADFALGVLRLSWQK